jgi:hypothetical protein
VGAAKQITPGELLKLSEGRPKRTRNENVESEAGALAGKALLLQQTRSTESALHAGRTSLAARRGIFDVVLVSVR